MNRTINRRQRNHSMKSPMRDGGHLLSIAPTKAAVQVPPVATRRAPVAEADSLRVESATSVKRKGII